MGLGREATLTGDTGQRLGASQQLLGPFEPQPKQIAMRRATQTLAKHAGEVIFAEARLLCQLSQEELCVSDLEQRLGIQQPSLSQQLGVLRREELVLTRREGKHVYYRVADARVLGLLQTLYTLFCDTGEAPHAD